MDERKSHFYSEYKLLKSVPKIGGLHTRCATVPENLEVEDS